MKTLIHLFFQLMIAMVLLDVCIILIPKPIRFAIKKSYRLAKKLISLVIIQVCKLCGIKVKSNKKYTRRKNNTKSAKVVNLEDYSK